MTEKEAWLQLAEQWATAEKLDGDPYKRYWCETSTGLCNLLRRGSLYKHLPMVTYTRMLFKIEKAIPEGKVYLFPTDTEAGKYARIQFCLDQAAKC